MKAYRLWNLQSARAEYSISFRTVWKRVAYYVTSWTTHGLASRNEPIPNLLQLWWTEGILCPKITEKLGWSHCINTSERSQWLPINYQDTILLNTVLSVFLRVVLTETFSPCKSQLPTEDSGLRGSIEDMIVSIQQLRGAQWAAKATAYTAFINFTKIFNLGSSRCLAVPA